MDSSEFLLMPHDRVGALIGKKGATKRKIERLTETKLVVDSREGEVEVIQKGNPLKYLKAMSIVKAIARGFSPQHASRLSQDGVMLQIIDLREFFGKSEGTMKAKKGRVIGTRGKARNEIEQDTGALISVYGKTISIIGTEEEISKALRAVEMLLKGASHTHVYDVLKRRGSGGRFEL